MARIRSIKPDLCKDETLAGVSRDARWLFVGLITISDDYGRFRAHDALIRGEVFPYDDVTRDEVGAWVAELVDAGRIRTYTVEGQAYGHLVNWARHQRVDNGGKSDIPPPPHDDGSRTSRTSEDIDSDSPPSSASCGELRRVLEDSSETRGDPSASCDDSPLYKEGKGRDKEGKGREAADAAAAADTPDTPEADPETARLCELLADLIEANGSKRPRVNRTWIAACDRLRRIDGHPPDHIERAIRWCQADDFWQANVMSMPKLREKWDVLRLQAERQKRTGPPSLAVVRDAANAIGGNAALAEYRRQHGLTA
jgi:hypothetical protein